MDENYNEYNNRQRSSSGLTAALIIAAAAVVLLVVTLIVGTIYNVSRGLTAWGSTSNYSYSDSSSYTSASDFTVPTAGISGVSIDWISGNVTIVPTDGDEIKVSEINGSSDPDDMLRYRVDRGTLVIRFRKSGRWVPSVNLKKDLIVEIPLDIAAALDIDIDVVSADVDINTGGEITEMDLKSVGVDSVSGHVCAADINTASLKIGMVSGEVIVSGNISEADIETVSGNISFDVYSNPEELDIVTVSGRVEIGLPEDPREVDVDTVSGSITVNGIKTKHSYESEDSLGSGEIDIETVSGDVTIAKRP